MSSNNTANSRDKSEETESEEAVSFPQEILFSLSLIILKSLVANIFNITDSFFLLCFCYMEVIIQLFMLPNPRIRIRVSY